MCLAVPGNIIEISEGPRATVDMLGARREVSLRLVPEARVGDYVLVHAGFGIQVIDPEEAQRTLEIIQELDEAMADELPAGTGTPA